MQVGIGSSSTNDVIGISLEDFDATALALQADISSTTNAGTALDKLDTAIDSVNSLRSGFGAVQNRLESALNNLETYTENLSSSASRIRDADFAFETAELSKHQIMQQAGISILGQANGLNTGALRLIG